MGRRGRCNCLARQRRPSRKRDVPRTEEGKLGFLAAVFAQFFAIDSSRLAAPERHSKRTTASNGVRRSRTQIANSRWDMGERKLRGDGPKVFTVAEVAEMFGRQPRTVRGWIADGLLPHLTIGRSVFVPGDALAKMVANAATKAAGKPPKTNLAKATGAAVRKPRDDNPLP